MNKFAAIILCLCMLGTSHLLNSAEEPVDLVMTNGTIITMDPALPRADAIAIRADKIVWVGAEQSAKKWIDASAKVIDLKRSYVYPGLIDSHAHIIGLGTARVTIDLVRTPDLESILKKVQERVAKAEKGQWI